MTDCFKPFIAAGVWGEAVLFLAHAVISIYKEKILSTTNVSP